MHFGKNIANINTDGYKKRQTALEEVTGAGGGVTEISDQTGLGVRVEDIKRAFDQFLVDKVRQTQSLYQKADTYLDEVKDLENLLAELGWPLPEKWVHNWRERGGVEPIPGSLSPHARQGLAAAGRRQAYVLPQRGLDGESCEMYICMQRYKLS